MVGPDAPVSVLKAPRSGNCCAGQPAGLPVREGFSGLRGVRPLAECGVLGTRLACLRSGRQWPHATATDHTNGRPMPAAGRRATAARLLSSPRRTAARSPCAQTPRDDPLHALTSHTTAHSRTTATPAPPEDGNHTHQPPHKVPEDSQAHTRTGQAQDKRQRETRASNSPEARTRTDQGSRREVGGVVTQDGGVRGRTSLRRGRSGSGMAGGTVRGCGSIVAREGLPSRLPSTQASRAATAQGVKVVRTVARSTLTP